MHADYGLYHLPSNYLHQPCHLSLLFHLLSAHKDVHTFPCKFHNHKHEIRKLWSYVKEWTNQQKRYVKKLIDNRSYKWSFVVSDRDAQNTNTWEWSDIKKWLTAVVSLYVFQMSLQQGHRPFCPGWHIWVLPDGQSYTPMHCTRSCLHLQQNEQYPATCLSVIHGLINKWKFQQRSSCFLRKRKKAMAKFFNKFKQAASNQTSSACNLIKISVLIIPTKGRAKWETVKEAYQYKTGILGRQWKNNYLM